MDKTASIKIQTLSFYAILIVVICHAYNLAGTSLEANKDFIFYFQHYITAKSINFVVIPLFFFLSGYLFFFNHDYKLNTFKLKISKRFRSLLLPYLTWNLIWFVIVYLVQLVPQLAGSFTKPLYTLTIQEQLFATFVEPINYPFWFLRELILYVLVTPLIYVAIKYLKHYFIIFLFILIFLKTPSLFTFNNVNLFQFAGLFFFSLGSFTAIKKINIVSNLKSYWYLIILIVWGIFIVLDIYIKANYGDMVWLTIFTQRMSSITGFITFMFVYDYLNKKYNFKSKKIYQYNFIIYAAHGLLIIYATKVLLKLVGENEFILFVSFILMPFFITAICIALAKGINRISPKTYSFLIGNR